MVSNLLKDREGLEQNRNSWRFPQIRQRTDFDVCVGAQTLVIVHSEQKKVQSLNLDCCENNLQRFPTQDIDFLYNTNNFIVYVHKSSYISKPCVEENGTGRLWKSDRYPRFRVNGI